MVVVVVIPAAIREKETVMDMATTGIITVTEANEPIMDLEARGATGAVATAPGEMALTGVAIALEGGVDVAARASKTTSSSLSHTTCLISNRSRRSKRLQAHPRLSSWLRACATRCSSAASTIR